MRTDILRRLNFRHLHYFWVVAKESHLTRAAELLHVSQSSVSSQIRQLETALGHDLFLRDGRRLHLTEIGRLVLEYAESIFNLGAELLETVGGADKAMLTLRIGAVATLSRNFQQNLLREFIGDEHLHLVLESASLNELLERLKVHELDVVLSNRPVIAGETLPVRCQQVARHAVCLVGPPRRGRRFRLPFDLAQVALILPGQSSDLRSQFDRFCDTAGIELRISAEVDDMAMLRLLARDSGAVAMVPEVVVQDELAQGVLEKYCELPDIYENFYATTARRHFQSAPLEALLDSFGKDGSV